MKRLLLLLLLTPFILSAQVCDPNGNIVIFSNYDGGDLTIDIDVDIPNLKIGVVTYEGTTITLTGTYLSNVTAVEYAGYNASNAHCGGVINTSINGAPGGATTNIVITPTSTLTNSNGSGSIVCAYSCDNGTSQGGCNTADQVEDYFLTLFGGSIYLHDTQYGCWSGTQLVSTSGACCAVVPLASTTSFNEPTCFGFSDGSISISTSGGVPPYTYAWTPNVGTTNTVNSLGAGTYNVTVEDANGDTTMHVITLTDPTQLTGTFTSTPDPGDCSGSITVTVSGGTAPYSYFWDSAGGGGNVATATGLCAGVPCVVINDVNGCSNQICDTVKSIASIGEGQLRLQANIYPNPSSGNITVNLESEIQQTVTFKVYDAQSREIENVELQLLPGDNMMFLELKTKGIYIVEVQSSKGNMKRKFVIE